MTVSPCTFLRVVTVRSGCPSTNTWVFSSLGLLFSSVHVFGELSASFDSSRTFLRSSVVGARFPSAGDSSTLLCVSVTRSGVPSWKYDVPWVTVVEVSVPTPVLSTMLRSARPWSYRVLSRATLPPSTRASVRSTTFPSLSFWTRTARFFVEPGSTDMPGGRSLGSLPARSRSSRARSRARVSVCSCAASTASFSSSPVWRATSSRSAASWRVSGALALNSGLMSEMASAAS
ncbi:hypothetical protein COEX109129_40030 [Corallococcus exiguus]